MTLYTSPVTVTTCPRCRRLLLTGIAEGLRARVDPTPINRAGLIAAILANRPAYRLTRSGLVHLDQERIKSRTIDGPTVTTHKCAQPIPAEYQDTTAAPTPPQQTEGIPY
jgi:hypothetical protein